MKKKTMVQRIRDNRLCYLFVLPAILVIGIFKYYPFLTSIYQSLYEWNGANIHRFTGIGNYVELFQDDVFWQSMVNILKICIFTVVINLFFPFVAAELVANLKGRKQNFFKIGFIVPMVVPGMVVTLLWRWILAGDSGIVNMILEKIGLGSLATPWLATSATSLWAILAIGFPWISGLPFLLYLAGRQAISNDLYECASLEGASTWQKIRHIDIPLLSGQRKLIITYMLIQAFQLFDRPMVLTNGGPGTSSMTPALYLYQRAFNNNEFGYSATIGVVLFITVLVVTVFNQKVVKEENVAE